MVETNNDYSFDKESANLILETTAELVKAVMQQRDKKLDQLIKLQTDMLALFQNLLKKNGNNGTAPSSGGNTSGNRPNCAPSAPTSHAIIQRFLMTNAGSLRLIQPADLQTGSRPRTAAEDAWGQKPQSSGN